MSWRDPAAWSPFEAAPAERPLRGLLSARGFRFRKFSRYRNSCQTEVVGRFIPGPDGTEIVLAFGLSRWAAIGGSIWFGVMLLMLAGSLGHWVLTNERSLADLGIAVVSIGLLALVTASTAFGRWLARGDERFLIDFLSPRWLRRSCQQRGRLPQRRMANPSGSTHPASFRHEEVARPAPERATAPPQEPDDECPRGIAGEPAVRGVLLEVGA